MCYVQRHPARPLPTLRARELSRSSTERHSATARDRAAQGGVMRFKIFMQVSVDARDQSQAVDWAKKFEKLLKNPMAKTAIVAEGIKMIGEPVALQPKPETP